MFLDQIACVDPEVCKIVCDNSAGCTNIAYPKLVVELMPEGIPFMSLLCTCMCSSTGADPGFQVRGHTWVFLVKNHDFTQKNHIFSNFRGEGGGGGRRARCDAPLLGSAPDLR